jgi:hypothetical protein
MLLTDCDHREGDEATVAEKLCYCAVMLESILGDSVLYDVLPMRAIQTNVSVKSCHNVLLCPRSYASAPIHLHTLHRPKFYDALVIVKSHCALCAYFTMY